MAGGPKLSDYRMTETEYILAETMVFCKCAYLCGAQPARAAQQWNELWEWR